MRPQDSCLLGLQLSYYHTYHLYKHFIGPSILTLVSVLVSMSSRHQSHTRSRDVTDSVTDLVPMYVVPEPSPRHHVWSNDTTTETTNVVLTRVTSVSRSHTHTRKHLMGVETPTCTRLNPLHHRGKGINYL